MPVTPLRNDGGWGRIRTGCLWSFTPALFLMSFPTADQKAEGRRQKAEGRRQKAEGVTRKANQPHFLTNSYLVLIASCILFL